MLVTDDEVQRRGALRAGRSLLAGRSFRVGDWRGRCGDSLVRWPLILFIVHVQRANDEELAGGTCDFVHDFSRGTGRSFERDLNHVALD